MNIKEIKRQIESKTIPDSPLIFVGKDNFIPNQYIREISKIKGKEIEYIEDLSLSSTSLFAIPNDKIQIYKTEELIFNDINLLNEKCLYIICNKVSDLSKELFKDIIIDIPKLEDWQIEDYAVSLLPEITEKSAKWLCDICGHDIHRVHQEVDRILLFSPIERKALFEECIQQGIYEDLSNQTVFDFTNAIIKKDYPTVYSLYKKIGVVDIEPLGVVTILKKNFEDIITIQLHSNPSPETCGMKPNKFWAIRYTCGVWSREELIRNYKILLQIDELVKTGKLKTDIEMIDYVLCNIFR